LEYKFQRTQDTDEGNDTSEGMDEKERKNSYYSSGGRNTLPMNLLEISILLEKAREFHANRKYDYSL